MRRSHAKAPGEQPLVGRVPSLPCPKCNRPMIDATRHRYPDGDHNKHTCRDMLCEDWAWDKGLRASCCGKFWVTRLVATGCDFGSDLCIEVVEDERGAGKRAKK